MKMVQLLIHGTLLDMNMDIMILTTQPITMIKMEITYNFQHGFGWTKMVH